MKKFLIIASVSMFSHQVAAQFIGPGTPGIKTEVLSARQAADDSLVILDGHLIRQLDKDTFEFKDTSGTVMVTINPKHMPTITIRPDTKVRITGKVDRRLMGIEIDVTQVDVLYPQVEIRSQD